MEGYIYISYIDDKLADCKKFDSIEVLLKYGELAGFLSPYNMRFYRLKDNYWILYQLKANRVFRHEKSKAEGWYVIDLTGEIDYGRLYTIHSSHLVPLMKAVLRSLKMESIGI